MPLTNYLAAILVGAVIPKVVEIDPQATILISRVHVKYFLRMIILKLTFENRYCILQRLILKWRPSMIYINFVNAL